jgi:hypothetical protein
VGADRAARELCRALGWFKEFGEAAGQRTLTFGPLQASLVPTRRAEPESLLRIAVLLRTTQELRIG